METISVTALHFTTNKAPEKTDTALEEINDTPEDPYAKIYNVLETYVRTVNPCSTLRNEPFATSEDAF